MFRPLGEGDVDIAAMVRTLEASGYEGWYVLEQDVMLDAPTGDQPVDQPGDEPVDQPGDRPGVEGPVSDVRKSLDYLLGVAP